MLRSTDMARLAPASTVHLYDEWANDVRVDVESNSTQPPAWFFARFGSGVVLELVDQGSLSGSRCCEWVHSGQVATMVQITEVAFDRRFRVLW